MKQEYMMYIENIQNYAIIYLKDRYPRSVSSFLGLSVEKYQDKVLNNDKIDDVIVNTLLSKAASYYDSNKVKIDSLPLKQKKMKIFNFLEQSMVNPTDESPILDVTAQHSERLM